VNGYRSELKELKQAGRCDRESHRTWSSARSSALEVAGRNSGKQSVDENTSRSDVRSGASRGCARVPTAHVRRSQLLSHILPAIEREQCA
jgi:hypothetical protein